jgi:SpoIID/LytB domain protein
MRKKVVIPAILLATSVAVVGLPATVASGATTYWAPVSKNWTIVGHGFGHRHGMGQYGAEGAALEGRSWRYIVGFYYPHTTRSTAGGSIRVLISANGSSLVEVRAKSGLTLTDLGDHSRWTLPVHSGLTAWRLVPHGTGTRAQYRHGRHWHTWTTSTGRTNLRGDAEFRAPGAMTLVTRSGDRRYRGALRSASPSAGSTSRVTVNVVKLDDYVQGVVPYEMPSSWQPQALRAQAVAARTYASFERGANPSGYYQICDTSACQVYGGATAEAASSNSAVRATKGVILTYHGSPAFTQFSSSTGGWTSDGGEPYLVAKRDPYDDFSGNPMHTWTRKVSSASIESRYPQIGRLVRLTATRRENHGDWGGNVHSARVVGTRGSVTLSGDTLRAIYALPSDWFMIKATAITKRWKKLRFTTFAVGPPDTRGEYRISHGDAQDFRHGVIYWSPRTGARDVKEHILHRYKAFGGPASSLGFPTSGMCRAPRHGRKAFFAHGGIWWSRHGAFVLTGSILDQYNALNGAAGRLGFPVSDVHKVSGGVRADFEHGSLTAGTSSRAAHVVVR